MSISAPAKSETRACHQVAAQKIAPADGLFEAHCSLDNVVNTELRACISGYSLMHAGVFNDRTSIKH